MLLPSDASPPFSLRDTVVLVPTAQAGRRLRRALAERADRAGSGVLMGPVITPFHLFDLVAGDQPVADEWAVSAIWLDVLSAERCRQLNGLFPQPPAAMDFAWRHKAANLLIDIRAQLAEAGLAATDLIADPSIHPAEQHRWRDLATVESVVRQRLSAHGWLDPVDVQLSSAAQSAPPVAYRRFVLAGCPDIASVIRRMLERWSSTIAVDVIVHAPASLASAFDDWGVPDRAHWCRDVHIDVEHPRAEVRVVDQPHDQAAAVASVLRANPEWSANGRFAVGVPDDAVTPYIIRALEDIGCPCYDPSGIACRMHPIFRFIKTWCDVAGQKSFPAIREFVRQGPVLAYAEKQFGVNSAELLIELDTAQNEGLPAFLDDLIAWVAKNKSDVPALASVMPWLEAQVNASDALTPDRILGQLSDLYRDFKLVPGVARDDAFIEVARFLVDAIDDIKHVAALAPGLGASDWIQLLLEKAESRSYQAQEKPRAIELEGWLELTWNNHPLVIVTGMNEGFVPGGRLDDLFIPDSVREKLGMRCDASRFARDSYLLAALNESRRANGRLVLISGRKSDQGDVLKPSRLFWRCPDEVMVRRALLVFTAQEKVVALPEKVFSLSLRTEPPDERARQRVKRTAWNVTDFSAYLKCPFRFYLQRVLEMEGMDDAKEEMDDLDFGKFVHNALELFGQDETLSTSRDIGKVGALLTSLVHDQLHRTYGLRPPLVVQLQAESAIQRLKAFAALHVADLSDGWRIEKVEQKFIAPFGSMEVRGKIDRIDRHPDGRLRVLDYKTSDNVKKAPEAIHLRTPRDEDTRPYVAITLPGSGKKKNPSVRHWSDLQLPLYLHFIRENYGADTPVTAGYVQLAKSVTDIQFALWDGLTPDLVDAAVACAHGVLHDASRGIYGPPLIDHAGDTLDERWWPDFLAQVLPPDPGGLV